MAITVTILADDQYVVEITEPEFDWMETISARCCWDEMTVLSTALNKGLSDLVLITSQCQGGFELTDEQEVPE